VRIWVDADACPVVIRDILVKAAERTATAVTFVANQPVQVPRSPHVRTLQVPGGFDVADNEIVARVEAGDLVVTGDIPLAAEVIARGAHALGPRGELHTRDNIGARLNMRDFMDTMRASGVVGGGPPALGQAERQAFARHLDTLVSRAARQRADAVAAQKPTDTPKPTDAPEETDATPGARRDGQRRD